MLTDFVHNLISMWKFHDFGLGSIRDIGPFKHDNTEWKDITKKTHVGAGPLRERLLHGPGGRTPNLTFLGNEIFHEKRTYVPMENRIGRNNS